MPDQAPQMPLDLLPLLAAAAGIVLLLVLVRAVRRALRRRRRFRDRIEPKLAIDVAQLSQQGPPATGPVLAFYHLPVGWRRSSWPPAGRAHDRNPAVARCDRAGLAESRRPRSAPTPLARATPPPGSPTLLHPRTPARRGRHAVGLVAGWLRPTIGDGRTTSAPNAPTATASDHRDRGRLATRVPGAAGVTRRRAASAIVVAVRQVVQQQVPSFAVRAPAGAWERAERLTMIADD